MFAIVGAGIGGLATALALALRNIPVVIFEQAKQLSEIGAGIHISPNGMHVIKALGLEESIKAVAAYPSGIATRNYATGDINFESLFNENFEKRFGAPFCSFHRADLHAVLAGEAHKNTKIEFRLAHKLVAIKARGNEVVLHFENNKTFCSTCVIGADGIHSVVKHYCHGPAQTRFTGHVAYRGMVPSCAMRSEVLENKFNIWVGPGKHVVAYPVRRGELINYVALVEEDGWRDESWTTLVSANSLTDSFKDWCPTVQTLISSGRNQDVYKWALLGREPLISWSTENVTLLGDAAHPMVPYLAQGAVMALEDSWVLATCLAETNSIHNGLKRYEEARLTRTSSIQKAAWEQGQLNHAVGKGPQNDEFKGGRFADPSWIYGVDVTKDYPL